MHNQYDAGMIDYTDVSSRDASRISAQQNLLSLYSSSLENSVTLIESLGGGWEGLASEEPGKAQQ
jgi:outer membrane protein TolC